MLTGEYYSTLDEKGRLSFPAKFREELAVESLVLTKGPDRCLWVFHPARWREVEASLKEMTESSKIALPFMSTELRVRRMFLAPAQEVEIDKTGRIAVQQNLRDWAHLTKECVVAGQVDYFEIWDKDLYNEMIGADCAEESFNSAWEELGRSLRGD